MPLVFGGAPIVNVAVWMLIHPPKSAINPMLFVGFVLASIGAGMVLYPLHPWPLIRRTAGSSSVLPVPRLRSPPIAYRLRSVRMYQRPSTSAGVASVVSPMLVDVQQLECRARAQHERLAHRRW